MITAPKIRGQDLPHVGPWGLLHRGRLAQDTLGDLQERGVAMLQGPAGSGTSCAALATAELWEGPVVWSRSALWIHLADLARPLWAGPAPDALQRAPAEQLVDLLLEHLRREGTLLVLDDLDEALPPGSGGAQPRDTALDLFLVALNLGGLKDSGAGVLITSRRSLRTLPVPVRPIPPLTPQQASLVVGDMAHSLAPGWLRRPGALALLRHLPAGIQLPEPTQPWGGLVLGLIDGKFDDVGLEVAMSLAVTGVPAEESALTAASGAEPNVTRERLLQLEELGIAQRQEAGWRCPRHLRTPLQATVSSLLPSTSAQAASQRLAGFYLRKGADLGHGWTSAEPARTSRLGIRYAVAAGDGRMATQAALHSGTAAILERLQAFRFLRDDLSLALSAPTAELEDIDLARAWLALGEAAARLADHSVTDRALQEALDPASRCGDPGLLRAVHTRLATRLLLAGEPSDARQHAHLALLAATAQDDVQAQCDLQNTLGSIHLSTGDLSRAEAAFSRSLELARDLGDERRAAGRQAGLAGVLLYRGELSSAESMLAESATAAHELGDESGAVHRRLNQALCRSLRADCRGAMELLRQIVTESAIENPRVHARFLSFRANLRRLAGDIPGARSDLRAAEHEVSTSGDRDSASDLASAWGHLHRTVGAFDEAESEFQASLEALAPGREPALVAAREIELVNSRSWKHAEEWLDGDESAFERLSTDCQTMDAAARRIEARPFYPRFVSARMELFEGMLLRDSLAGTAPVGLVRSIERLMKEADQDPERAETGEPGLRTALAWACLLCGEPERARELAEKASFDAGLCGLATVQGRARVLFGKDAPHWNGQAKLLQRLLARHSDSP